MRERSKEQQLIELGILLMNHFFPFTYFFSASSSLEYINSVKKEREKITYHQCNYNKQCKNNINFCKFLSVYDLNLSTLLNIIMVWNEFDALTSLLRIALYSKQKSKNICVFWVYETHA